MSLKTKFQFHNLWLFSVRAETVILYIYQQSGAEGEKSVAGKETLPSSQERSLQCNWATGEASEEDSAAATDFFLFYQSFRIQKTLHLHREQHGAAKAADDGSSHRDTAQL